MRSWWDNKSWRLGNVGIFTKLRNILSRIHLLLTRDTEHSKIFKNIPIIGFKKGKSLKDVLVRAKVPPLKTEEGFCGPCNKDVKFLNILPKHISLNQHLESTLYSIKPQNLNCASKNVVYHFSCKTYHKEYTKSTEGFQSRFNN